MRNNTLLDALFPKTRQELLGALLLCPERRWYLSSLARYLHTRPSSIQRELAVMTQSGLLRRTQDGNRVCYQVDEAFPLLPELRGLFLKTSGLADQVRAMLEPFLPGLHSAFIYGSLARGERSGHSDVDLMLIGEVRMLSLVPSLREMEQALGMPVNVTLFTPTEFWGSFQQGSHFLHTVMHGPKIYLKGTDDELADLVGGEAYQATHDQSAGVG